MPDAHTPENFIDFRHGKAIQGKALLRMNAPLTHDVVQ